MRAHVGNQAIVLHFLPSENPSPEEWETMLDQLKSVHIPDYYETGKRMRVLIDPEGRERVLILLTSDTVTVDHAIELLRGWNVDVHDER